MSRQNLDGLYFELGIAVVELLVAEGRERMGFCGAELGFQIQIPKFTFILCWQLRLGEISISHARIP